jgi:hypothetical protein
MKEMYEVQSETRPASEPRWIQGEALEDFWSSVWRSDQGKAWAAGGSEQAAWLKERLGQRPFFVCDPWEPDLQRRHFSQMWGQVFTRVYSNPALEDLYWIHELTHWATADLRPSASFEDWRGKWDLNELRASCASEILAHGDMPGILRVALARDPWAARFGELGGSNPEDPSTWTPASREAFATRLAIRDGLRAPSCEDESWFAGFKAANERWASLWSEKWRDVDEGLRAYGEALATGDPSLAKRALEEAGSLGLRPALPYAEQARSFMELDGNKLAPEAPFKAKSDGPRPRM